MVLSGCTTSPQSPPVVPEVVEPAPPIASTPTGPSAPVTSAPSAPAAPVSKTPAAKPTAPPDRTFKSAPAPSASALANAGALFKLAMWSDLPGWRDDALSEGWSAFIASCGPLANRQAWRESCAAAARLATPNTEAIRQFFERHFKPWQVLSGDGVEEGLITGYYEPLLRGSRTPNARYRHPLYAAPEDLITIDLGETYPELKGLRLRGRLEGRRIVPYYERSHIESAAAPLRGKEFVWVDDAIDLFFLHIQGSGRILLDNGETMRVGYADQNGYPYRSIGRLLVERGELTLEQASMQGIKAWARERPEQLKPLLNNNPSYVFFRELAASGSGPPGSLGVPLTPNRSIAVDTRYVPLGAPVYMSTTWPNTARPLNRLMLAQDTGSAIRGAVRADFFWGYGEAAAREAGRMKQRLRMWVLLPHAHPAPAGSATSAN
jgi:membrane-bound lytic murein transglycosylase A